MARISEMAMHSTGGNIDAALGFGIVGGLVWFVKGFRVYREYRVLADTPEMPIRSIAMGLVEVHGKAKAAQTIPSPVTRTPCCFYKVDIERWVRDKDGGRWSHAVTDAQGVQFHLEDATGKVLVNAQGAEYDLIRTGRAETGRGMGGSLSRVLWGKGDPALATGPMASDAELYTYALAAVSAHRGGSSFDMRSLLPNLGGSLSVSLAGSLSSGRDNSDRFRLTEYLILPDHWYDVTGTCTENPAAKDEHDRNLIRKGENEPTFLISWRSEKGIKQSLRRRAALHIFGGGLLSVTCLGVLLAKFGWL
jgi:hypothetical protein